MPPSYTEKYPVQGTTFSEKFTSPGTTFSEKHQSSMLTPGLMVGFPFAITYPNAVLVGIEFAEKYT